MSYPMYGLSHKALLHVFPFHFILDSSLIFQQTGPSLSKLFPTLLGESFGKHFRIHRPHVSPQFEDICTHSGSAYLLVSHANQVSLRGQMVPLEDEELVIFLGSPHMTKASDVHSLGLALSDFAIHDSVADNLFLLQARHSALSEAKELALHLSQKQKDLKAINRDLKAEIEERRQVEEKLATARDEAIQASRVKSQFLATVSHEIRTPLNGILGMSQLLLELPLSDKQREFASIIAQEGDSLLSLINEFLDFSKVEAGKLALENDEFSLRLLVENVVSAQRPIAMAKGVDFFTKIDPEIPNLFSGDANRLRQILVNLVGNAIKFTEKGAVSVAVSIMPHVENDTLRTEQLILATKNGSLSHIIELAIHDSGIGIHQESIPFLFEAFTQVDSSATRKYGGTGLGLAICKRFVELMGGTISVQSQLGKGSSFIVHVPLQAIEKSASQDETKTQAAASKPIGNHRQRLQVGTADASLKSNLVLVVEDQRVNQKITVAALKKFNFSAEVAENGQEAVGLLRDRYPEFCAVIMDWRMPVMDGITATERIREFESQSDIDSRIPIIGMTANAMKGDREACLDAGMDDYLTKPIRFDDLQQTLERWLGPLSPPHNTLNASSADKAT